MEDCNVPRKAYVFFNPPLFLKLGWGIPEVKGNMLYPRFRSGLCLQQAKNTRNTSAKPRGAAPPGGSLCMSRHGWMWFLSVWGNSYIYTQGSWSNPNLNQQHFTTKSFHFNGMLNEFSLENFESDMLLRTLGKRTFLNKTAWFNVFMSHDTWWEMFSFTCVVFDVSHREAQSWADLRQDVHSDQPADVHRQ